MNENEIIENNDDQQSAEDESKRFPWLLLLIGLAGIGLAIFIGTQALGVLFAIISPPDAPLPANVTLIRHDNQSYGVDEWVYDTDTGPCELLEFYQMLNGICRVPPVWCSPDENGVMSLGSAGGQLTATCTGVQEFSIFAMRWRSSITSVSVDGPSSLQVFREVLWGGSPIEVTPSDDTD